MIGLAINDLSLTALAVVKLIMAVPTFQLKDAQDYSGSFDDLQKSGLYWITSSTGAPIDGRWWLAFVFANTSTVNRRVMQVTIDDRSGIIYQRILSGTDWSKWRQIIDMDALTTALDKYTPASDTITDAATKTAITNLASGSDQS